MNESERSQWNYIKTMSPEDPMLMAFVGATDRKNTIAFFDSIGLQLH